MGRYKTITQVKIFQNRGISERLLREEDDKVSDFLRMRQN